MNAKDYTPLYDWAIREGYDPRTARAMLERLMQASITEKTRQRQWLEDESVKLEEALDAIEESTGLKPAPVERLKTGTIKDYLE